MVAAARRAERSAFLSVVAVCGVLHAFSLHRGTPAGDSGELIAVAHTLGTAHPPGYPLWTLLAAAWERLVPVGSVAFRLNLFSAVAAVLAAGIVGAVVAGMARDVRTPQLRNALGVFAGVAFGQSAPAWKYGLVAEVFALNALLAAIALAAFVALLERREAGRRPDGPVAAIALVAGLLVAHHHSLVLLLAPLGAAALWIALRMRPGPTPRGWATAAALFALGLAPLLWLPWAAGRTPPAPLAWGDPTTPAGFWHVLTRADYGTFQLAPRESGLVADTSHVALFLRALPHDFSWVAVAFAAVGLVALARARARRPLAAVLVAFFLLQLAFFTRVQFPSDALYRGVVERFYILPAVAVALCAGAGATAVFAWLERALATRGPRAGLVLAPVVGLLVLFGAGMYAPERQALVDQHRNRLVDDLAANVLASVPDSAVLFVRGDLFHNALAVKQLVEGARPDVVVLDQELLTYPWYVARARRLHPGVLPPRLGAQDRYEGTPATGNGAWLDHLLPRRPVAFLGLKDASYAGRYELVPVGFVLRAYRAGAAPDARAQARMALALFPRLSFDAAWRGYDPTSFEAVERARLLECVTRTTRLLCAPAAFALAPDSTPGFPELIATLERSRSEAGKGPLPLPNPPEDAELVRARGYLYALHPGARDSVRAEADLAATLAREPDGPRAAEARSVLAWLRQKPVAAVTPATP